MTSPESFTMGEHFQLEAAPITTIQLVKYAGASDDYNRIHYDLPYATDAGLGGVIAHGMLTMGFMAQAVTAWSGPRAFVRHLAARFTAPVRPGESVRIVGTVKGSDIVDGQTEVRCELVAMVLTKTVAQGEVTLRFVR